MWYRHIYSTQYRYQYTRTYKNSNNYPSHQTGNPTQYTRQNDKRVRLDWPPLYTPTKLHIELSLEINQIRERVFLIGNLNSFLSINLYYNTILYHLSNLLDKGDKFVPCYYNDELSFLIYTKYLNVSVFKRF